MKVFVALALVFVSVSARGSGPYLPRGWKPQGPAFYLPAEIVKSAPSPVEDVVFPETEASGSDALREYGPPRLEVVSVNQGLPEVATEQTFFAEVRNDVVSAVEEVVSVEANTEQVAAIVEEVSTVTESQVVEEQATELSEAQPTAGAQVVDVLEQLEVVSEAVSEQINEAIPTVVAIEEIVVPTPVSEVVVSLAQQELVQEAPATEVVATVVNNIAEAIVNLEKEVKAVEVQAIENVSGVTSTQEASGSLEQGPEGFLEYGPPGFTEYGPPKQEDLARIAAEVSSAVALENNEVRRRRFSPKFRSSKRH